MVIVWLVKSTKKSSIDKISSFFAVLQYGFLMVGEFILTATTNLIKQPKIFIS